STAKPQAATFPPLRSLQKIIRRTPPAVGSSRVARPGARMAEPPLSAVVRRLVRGLPPTDGTADDALLERFVAWRDEAAFELLVYRHGPLVRGVCRRVLRHEQDAEDAFQAAFLALARKAAAVHGRSLAGWLYRVAFHAALKARARSGRRDEVGLPEVAAKAADPSQAAHVRETQAILDAEVMRLPERFR